MRKHNPVLWFLLAFTVIGYYVWLVRTKEDMNTRGADIPTAWIILIPLVGSLYFYWRWSKGIELVSRGEMSAIVSMIMLVLIPLYGTVPVMSAILNKAADRPALPELPTARLL